MSGGGDGLYIVTVAPVLAGHGVRKIGRAVGDIRRCRGTQDEPLPPKTELDRQLAAARKRRDGVGRGAGSAPAQPDRPGYDIVLGLFELMFAAGAFILAVHAGIWS